MRSLFAFGLLLAVSLSAQQQSLHLNLADAEKLAIESNPQLSIARFNAAAARQAPKEYRAALLPALNGSVTGVGADSGSRLAAGALNNPVVYDRLASGLSGSQLITDFGRTRSLVASAQLRAEAQDQATDATRADILIATVRAYFAVLRANSVLQVAQQTVAARQLVSSQVTALFNSQLKSQLDVSFANVNLADAQLLLSQAQNDLSAAQAELAAAIGVPAQTSFSLSEEALPPPLPDQVEPLVEQAIQDRPELKNLRLQQSAAERSVQAEHASFYPTVALSAAAGVVPFGQAEIPGRYGAAGVNLSIPIFNGGLFRARQTEAELRAKAAAGSVNDLANRVIRDVRVAWLNAKTAFERVGLTDELLRQAQLGLDLAQGRYNLGLSSIVELSQAQLNLTSAQIASVTARYDYESQRSIVDYQTGALK